MRIAPELLQRIVEHAREAAPEECCGLFAVRDGVVVELHRAVNAAAQPERQFDIVGADHLRAADIDKRGDVVGIYHSHTRSAPEPSQTDLNFAEGWPGSPWLIVGLKGDEPDVRLWTIEGGEHRPAPLEVR